MSAMTGLEASMEALSLGDSQPFWDPFFSCKNFDFDMYLNLTTTCKSWNKNRFQRLLKEDIFFINALFSKIVKKSCRWGTGWFCLEKEQQEKISFFHSYFPGKYNHSLSISCSNSDEINCKVLAVVLQKFPNTRAIHFPIEQKISSEFFISCVNSCQKIVSLRMPSCSFVHEMSSICWPSSLKDLTISRDVIGSSLDEIVKACPQLERLGLWGCSKIDRIFFKNMLFPPSLRELNLSETKITDQALRQIAELCGKLSALSLCYCPYVTKQGIEQAGFSKETKIKFIEYVPRNHYHGFSWTRT